MSEVHVRPGEWILYRESGGYHPIEVKVERAHKVTPHLIKFDRAFWPRQVNRLSVVASFADNETAQRARDAIAGVSGEFERRRRAAEDELSRRITEARAAAEKQVARIVEQASQALATTQAENK